ncbi:MAG: hypothetical protein ABI181_09725 [Mycobacteriaceae bacterium]
MSVAARSTHVRDVVAHAPVVSLDDVSLGSYTFLPHHRSGSASAYTAPFSTGAAARGTIDVAVPLTDGFRTTPEAAGHLALRGPGDVIGIDARQVVRRFPPAGTRDAEPNDLAHCELDLPDLPWMFTPTAPETGTQHLPPWLRLVVVPTETKIQPAARPGLPPFADVPLRELPPPEDAWAWAHVQLVGPPRAGDPATPDPRLDPSNPTLNLARLICPRRLQGNRSWRAMLVPTFEVGRRVGTGDTTPLNDLRWSWTTGDPGAVRLPVYDHWTFATGPDGDFESLARRIRPVPAPPGTGRRLVDTTAPGMGLEVTSVPGTREVEGALTRPGPKVSAEPVDGAPGVWDPATTQALRERVEQPDRVQFDPAETDPAVAPPLYGGTHVASAVVPEPGTPPAWLRQLNLDPAHRVAAGLGAGVARMDQEDLMASAWAQLPSVLDANAALRAAQLARFVGGRLHARHLVRLDAGSLLAVTSRAHARTVTGPGVTVRKDVAVSATPTAAAASSLRKLARADGPVSRSATQTGGFGTLLADGDLAHDWCHRYSPPDGVRGLGDTGRAALLALQERPEVGAFGGPDIDLLADRLGRASLIDELTDGQVPPEVPDAQQVELTRHLALARLLEPLLSALPTVSDLEAGARLDNPALARVAGLLAQTAAVVQILPEWILGRGVAARHDLRGDPFEAVPGRVVVATDVIEQELISRLWTLLEAAGGGDHERVDEHTLATARQFLDVLAHEAAELDDQLEVLYEDARVDTADLREPARERLSIGGLDLPNLFEPRLTLGRRLRQRVPGLTDHFPGWLDNDRFDPVMAAPRFTHPMYEALNRYDPEWLLPGVSAIDPHEMMTVLASNPVFVEAFLLGLNHEFARELVWRGYPTDGRGTSFRSFWTSTEELAQPVDRLRAGDLGSHLSATASGRLVVLVRGELVRRHPHLLAHAVRQSGAAPPVTYETKPLDTLFQMPIGADLLLTGIALEAETALNADPAPGGVLPPTPPTGCWWFTLSEHVGQPRFGLDVPPPAGEAPLPSGPRDNLTWEDWPPVGDHIRPSSSPHPTGAALIPTSADLAWLLFQQPARAGYRLGRMLRPDIEQGVPWP